MNLEFSEKFEAVIDLPEKYPVFDLSSPEGQQQAMGHEYGIGRYLEHRPGIYQAENQESEGRDIHMGVDIGAPAGTPIKNFYRGTVYSVNDFNEPFDYGPTVVTEHSIGDRNYWVLWGHLNRECLQENTVGDVIEAGVPFAKVGSAEVNGGWPPHLHFQVSLVEPVDGSFNGVVSQSKLEEAKQKFPDPRCFLGPIY